MYVCVCVLGVGLSIELLVIVGCLPDQIQLPDQTWLPDRPMKRSDPITTLDPFTMLDSITISKIVSEYDQEIPQSQTADKPMAS